MAKPDYSNDMQTLADRSKQLRAIAAAQKEEEGGEVDSAPVAKSKKKSKPPKKSASEGAGATPPTKPTLSGTVEQLIESDNPKKAADEQHEWSRRLAYISTRIPEDMRELIDDLLFILKKEAKKDLGREPTLQDLASEAWGDLLAKYSERLPG